MTAARRDPGGRVTVALWVLAVAVVVAALVLIATTASVYVDVNARFATGELDEAQLADVYSDYDFAERLRVLFAPVASVGLSAAFAALFVHGRRWDRRRSR